MRITLLFLLFSNILIAQEKGLRLFHEFYTTDFDLADNVSELKTYQINNYSDTTFQRSIQFDTLGQVKQMVAKEKNNKPFYTAEYNFYEKGKFLICNWNRYNLITTDIYMINEKREIISWRTLDAQSNFESGTEIIQQSNGKSANVINIRSSRQISETESYVYNEFGKIQMIYNNRYNHSYLSDSMSYDTLGNLIELSHYDDKGTRTYYQANTYNSNNQLIKTIYRPWLDWRFSNQTIYTYDSLGFLLKETKQHIDNGKIKEETIYQYTYDAHGNWIRKNKIKKGRIVSYKLRVISYYD